MKMIELRQGGSERLGFDNKMKRQIVHTLQKYLFNPPIKLALGMGVPIPGYALLETTGTQDRKNAAHASRQRTHRESVLAGGRARDEGRIRPQH
jgi:hypothetical protein